jgi:TfoX/Sxy family transcriptional regulator of competence genes
MAYNRELAQRVREVVGDKPELEEKNMFGGVGFLLRGNMACGVYKDALIVRVGPESYQQSLDQQGVDPFDITGRPMKGWVMVREGIWRERDGLAEWVQQGMDYALQLPPK